MNSKKSLNTFTGCLFPITRSFIALQVLLGLNKKSISPNSYPDNNLAIQAREAQDSEQKQATDFSEERAGSYSTSRRARPYYRSSLRYPTILKRNDENRSTLSDLLDY